jgi:hypothetical protein
MLTWCGHALACTQMAEDMAQREAREAAQRAEIAALAGDAEAKKKELQAQQHAMAMVEKERQKRLAAVGCWSWWRFLCAVKNGVCGGGDGRGGQCHGPVVGGSSVLAD